MGHIAKPIQFFSDEITLKPHTATSTTYIDRPVTIQQFAHGQRVRLDQLDNGDFVCKRQDGSFIEGPEV